MKSTTKITIDGTLPKALALTKAELKDAALFFATRSSSRIKENFSSVSIIVQNDLESDEVHMAIMNQAGATDVITQRYDPMPGEEEGIVGELYVNAERAITAYPKRKGWSAKKEFLLYVAHGMDHLSGADDFTEEEYRRMRTRELRWLRRVQGACGAFR
ncbi:MAG: rRNA maturation RNase YbeY [Kiritimatiellae bacterium]|nr:rRNA maturation RNase YbeY [Kiritimatiellia bacterium]